MSIKMPSPNGISLSWSALYSSTTEAPSLLWLTAALVDQAYISKCLSDVQFAQVVGSGHFPQLEVPEQTNAAISTFLTQLRM